MNKCCKNCWKWKNFGVKCRVYWEGKKNCTMHQTEAQLRDEQEYYGRRAEVE